MRSLKISKLSIASAAVFIALFKPEGLPNTVKYAIQISMLGTAMMFILSRKIKVSDNVMVLIAIPVIMSSIAAYLDKIISLKNLINCFFYMLCTPFNYIKNCKGQFWN